MTVVYDQGRYWGKITHQRLGETKNGNPQLVLTFEIIGKVDPSDPEGALIACPTLERSVYRVITDNTLDYVIQDMDTLGWYGNKWSQFDEGNAECVDIRGKEMAFSCRHEPKKALDEATNTWVNTPEIREVWSVAQLVSGASVKPMDPKALSKLDAMFGKALKGRKPNNGSDVEKKETPPQRKPIAELTPDERNAELAEHASEIPF